MRVVRWIPLCVASAVAVLLLGTPRPVRGFAVSGGSLALDQRDFRVFDNFSDPTAGDNTALDPSWPGYSGATLAIWKGCVEWASRPHGDASGDPLQATVGDGGANFDPSFQGRADGPGAVTENVHSEIGGGDGPGGVLAFTESSGAGWRIRYERFETWQDGPGAASLFEEDLQSVACHEYGHALGLLHSEDPAATMFPTVAGGSEAARSIESDDVTGIQAVYGAAGPSKPVIASVASDAGGAFATITGSGFAATNNRVWFTQKGSGGDGKPVCVEGLASSLAGTQLVVTLPVAAGRGDVLVQIDGSGNADLSNPFPFDAVGPDPPGPAIAMVTPSAVASLHPFAEPTITITGSALDGVTELTVDGVPLPAFPPAWTIVDPGTIALEMPVQTTLGPVTLGVTGPFGSDEAIVDIVAPPVPVVRLQDGAEPAQVFSFAPAVARLGGQPGNLLILAISFQLGVSELPGLFHLDIGNNFQQYLPLLTFVTGPAGWTEFTVAPSGLPFGFNAYWQTLEFDVLTQALPLVESNVSTMTFVF